MLCPLRPREPIGQAEPVEELRLPEGPLFGERPQPETATIPHHGGGAGEVGSEAEHGGAMLDRVVAIGAIAIRYKHAMPSKRRESRLKSRTWLP